MRAILDDFDTFFMSKTTKKVIRRFSILLTLSNAFWAFFLFIFVNNFISNTIILNILIAYDVLSLIIVQLIIAHSFK